MSDMNQFLLVLPWLLMVTLICVALTLIGRGQVLKELGVPAWKGRIPFYGSYILYERIWKKEAFWLSFAALIGRITSWGLFIEALYNGNFSPSEISTPMEAILLGVVVLECSCTIVGLVIHYAAMKRLAQAFERGTFLAVCLLLCPPVFMMLLGFAQVEYLDEDEMECIGEAEEPKVIDLGDNDDQSKDNWR